MRLILLSVLMTGCMTNMPCPKDLGGPKEKCSVLLIPTPQDGIMTALETMSWVHENKLVKTGKLERKDTP